MDILYLAYYLSILTYVLGAALRGLPIPLVSIKKLGSRLMVDGVFSAFLVFSYKGLVYSISYFSSLLGSNWGAFNAWYIAEAAALTTLFLVLKTIGFIYNKIGLGFLASGLISPLVSLLIDVLVTVTVFYLAVSVIYATAKTLIAVGLLLYSVPFRLTRPAGAVLIALPIVFTIGAPFLPSFVSLFSTVTPPDHQLIQGEPALISLVDLVGNPVAYFVLNSTDREGKLLYTYLSDSNSVVNATSIDKWIPVGPQVLDFLLPGSKYTVEANITQGSKPLNLTYRVPNVISINVNHFIYYNTGEAIVENISRVNGTLTVVFDVLYNTKVYVVYEEGSSLVISVDGGASGGYETSFKWFNVNYKAFTADLSPGVHTLAVQVGELNISKPDVSEVSYLEITVEKGSVMPLAVSLVSLTFFRLLVLPVVYILILVSATLGLAKLLGGVEARISRVMVFGP